MALVKLTAIVDNISGSLGDVTFSRTKGGLALRARRNEFPSYVEGLEKWKERTGISTTAWKLLPNAIRENWNTAALEEFYSNRLGDRKNLSGFAFFVKTNNWLQHVGQPTAYYPPKKITQQLFTVLQIEIMKNNVMILAVQLEDGNVKPIIYIQASKPLSAGTMANYNWKEVTTEQLSSTDLVYFDISDRYMHNVGPMTPDKKVFFKVKLIDPQTGRTFGTRTFNGIIEE